MVIRQFRYERRSNSERRVLFAYMRRLSGYSRQHRSRLIAQYGDTLSLDLASRAGWTSFPRKFDADASVYWPIPTVCMTTCRHRRRRFCCSVPTAYLGICAMRGSRLPVSHVYNLRASAPYWANSACSGVEDDPRQSLRRSQSTRATAVSRRNMQRRSIASMTTRFPPASFRLAFAQPRTHRHHLPLHVRTVRTCQNRFRPLRRR